MLFRLKVDGEGENTHLLCGSSFCTGNSPGDPKLQNGRTSVLSFPGLPSCRDLLPSQKFSLLRNVPSQALDPENMSAQVYVCTYTIQYLRILLGGGIDHPVFYLSN